MEMEVLMREANSPQQQQQLSCNSPPRKRKVDSISNESSTLSNVPTTFLRDKQQKKSVPINSSPSTAATCYSFPSSQKLQQGRNIREKILEHQQHQHISVRNQLQSQLQPQPQPQPRFERFMHPKTNGSSLSPYPPSHVLIARKPPPVAAPAAATTDRIAAVSTGERRGPRQQTRAALFEHDVQDELCASFVSEYLLCTMEEKVKRFQLFLKIFFRYVELMPPPKRNNIFTNDDPTPKCGTCNAALKDRVRQIILFCIREHKRGNPKFNFLVEAMELRLIGCVGFEHWNNAKRLYQNYADIVGKRNTKSKEGRS